MRNDSEFVLLPPVNLTPVERRLITFLASEIARRPMPLAPERTALPTLAARALAEALGACGAHSGGHVCIGRQVIHLLCLDATDRERAALARRAAWWRRRADRAIERHVAIWAGREKRERRRLVQAARHVR